MQERLTEINAQFPEANGRELAVAVGEYAVLRGSAVTIDFNQNNLATGFQQGERDEYPGVHIRGFYWDHSMSEPEKVVSFLYHKQGPDGHLETEERGIVLQAVGYGVHPGHTGQEPSWYLVGPQIGTFNHATGEYNQDQAPHGVIAPKHFSLACIVDGPSGEPVLANSVQ